MKWSRRSSHSIQAGELIISRTVHSGQELYTLWRGSAVASMHDTAAAAKQAAKEMAA